MPRCRLLGMALQELLCGGRQISRMRKILSCAEGSNLGWFATICYLLFEIAVGISEASIQTGVLALIFKVGGRSR